MGVNRPTSWLLALLISIAVTPAQAQGSAEAWTGTWAAVQDDIDVQLWLVLRVENGQITGESRPAEVMRGSDPISSATLTGRRLTLEIEAYEEGEDPGRVVLELAADGASIRVIEGRIEGQRLGRYTLTRRDALWSRVQLELHDLGQENDADSLRSFVAEAEAVSAGLAAANSRALLDPTQVECALDVVTDAYQNNLSMARARAVALALARAAGTQTICNRDLDTLTVDGVGAPEAECSVIVVEDDDGETTLRARPSSRGVSAGTAPNGRTFSIRDSRGRWLRVSTLPERWVWAGNVRCLR